MLDYDPHAARTSTRSADAVTRTAGGLEARMAGVVVAALKEAFDRDSRRLELEREQLAAERQRAERALQLELQRQAGDREIGRLRLLAGVAGTGVDCDAVPGDAAGRQPASPRASRSAPAGCCCSARVAASFIAQARVAAALDALAGGDNRQRVRSGGWGALALVFMLAGLVLAGVAALLA